MMSITCPHLSVELRARFRDRCDLSPTFYQPRRVTFKRLRPERGHFGSGVSSDGGNGSRLSGWTAVPDGKRAAPACRRSPGRACSAYA
jgi:hypothetical protein